ncbi:hypothetical protein BURC_04841 [Burkholderiaceae bacterium]|nr:hypothetical protein BURC_04841 [Burkholderiaceae bacterium]
MSKNSIRLFFAATLVSFPILAAAAAQGERFGNGESFYGQPGAASVNVRVVDVSKAEYLNVRYGDTVVFNNGAKQFVWTFNGMDRVAVKLGKIAPPDFGSEQFTVYVPPDPLHRR